MSQKPDMQKLLYIYDLPKSTTSAQIAGVIKEKAKISLNEKPLINRKNPDLPFLSAMVKIENDKQLEEAKNILKYFKYDDVSFCRTLAFDKDMLGKNKEKLFDQSLFFKRTIAPYKPTDDEKNDPALKALLNDGKKICDFTADDLKETVVAQYKKNYIDHY